MVCETLLFFGVQEVLKFPPIWAFFWFAQRFQLALQIIQGIFFIVGEHEVVDGSNYLHSHKIFLMEHLNGTPPLGLIRHVQVLVS